MALRRCSASLADDLPSRAIHPAGRPRRYACRRKRKSHCQGIERRPHDRQPGGRVNLNPASRLGDHCAQQRRGVTAPAYPLPRPPMGLHPYGRPAERGAASPTPQVSRSSRSQLLCVARGGLGDLAARLVGRDIDQSNCVTLLVIAAARVVRRLFPVRASGIVFDRPRSL
jgi:hypothetical protein